MNPRKALQRAVIAGATLAAAAAWGHPNHADPGATTTLAHVFTEPDHLLAMLGVLLAGACAMRLVRKPQRKD